MRGNMRFSHEDIKEKLPEYIRETHMPDEVEAHLKECCECREEVSLLRELHDMPVPEPGDMFFETLPQRVRVSLKDKKKSLFFRLAPVFALIALVVTAGYIYYMIKTPDKVEEVFTFSAVVASINRLMMRGMESRACVHGVHG